MVNQICEYFTVTRDDNIPEFVRANTKEHQCSLYTCSCSFIPDWNPCLNSCLRSRVIFKAGLYGRIFLICPPVNLRPHFQSFNDPSSESVHEVDGPSSKINPLVHLRMIILAQCPNQSMRWAKILVHCPHGQVDGLTVRRRPSSSEEACFKVRKYGPLKNVMSPWFMMKVWVQLI